MVSLPLKIQIVLQHRMPPVGKHGGAEKECEVKCLNLALMK